MNSAGQAGGRWRGHTFMTLQGNDSTDNSTSPRGNVGKWGRLEYTLIMGGLCILLLGTIWMMAGSEDRLRFGWSLWRNPEGIYPDEAPILPLSRDNSRVKINIVRSAVGAGAVCLDGSPPAYFLDRGSGAGADNWVVFLEGGGWCTSHEECLERSSGDLGSSKNMPRRAVFDGMLGRSPLANPDFHTWNRVWVKYCDGGSFNGDATHPVEVTTGKRKSGLVYYRGQRIWKALMQDILEKGMKTARKAFLTGSSAGGLASILHCDQFRDLFPNVTDVKCLSDAAFFLHLPDVSGGPTIETVYSNVVQLQNMHMANTLPEPCTSQREPALCLFPEYLIGSIRTPLFIVNPAYDYWQFWNVLLPPSADLEWKWADCRESLSLCSEIQLETVQQFRQTLLDRLQPFLKKKENGAFIDSCYLHGQIENSLWSGDIKVDNKSVAQVVGDWYFQRDSSSKVVDCPFPCNPTCS